MEAINFFVPGQPRTAGSKTAFKAGDGRIIVRPASKFTKPWMDTVKYFAIQKVGRMCLIQEAVRLKIIFTLLRPQGHYGTGRNQGKLKDSAPELPVVTPDLSKAVRAIEDALTGLIWKDDKQVAQLFTYKVYGEPMGADITIEEI